MNIAVCIKQVPDVNAPIQIKEGELIQDASRAVLNAYDASAVEAALVLAENHGGEVDIVSVGPEKARETIRKALAMGADRATHIVIPDDASHDSAVYAEILSRHFRQSDRSYDIIACGKQSQDTDAGLAGGMLARKLHRPYTTNAVALEYSEGQLQVTRQADSGQQIIGLPDECLVTCSNDMNEPRIPSLKGIMQSKKKPMDVITLEDMEMDESQLQSRTTVESYEEKPEKEPGPRIEDAEPEEMASQLADYITNKAGI